MKKQRRWKRQNSALEAIETFKNKLSIVKLQKRRMKNKKGVEINVTTVIILILAIVVLVVLVLWFTGGINRLFGGIRTAADLYGVDNIQVAKNFCESEGSMNVVDFCQKKIPLTILSNKTTNYFYCFQDPIKARLIYTDPATGTKISVGSADKCGELGYPTPSE